VTGQRTKKKFIWKKRFEVATIVYSGKLWKTKFRIRELVTCTKGISTLPRPPKGGTFN